MKRKYLELSLERLKKWIPFPGDALLAYYEKYESESVLEETPRYHYCLFAWPVLNAAGMEVTDIEDETVVLERIVLLVYDDQDRIIADCSGLHASVQDMMTVKPLFDHLCEESDWMYLEHYTLFGMCYPDLEYPFCEHPEENAYDLSGETLLYSNAYVTKAYRRQGIFRMMTEMMREYTLRNAEGAVQYLSAMAMDPDIACYGPDARDERYVYSFVKDEPDRLRNAEIAKKIGYTPICLEETEEDPDGDGTKRWFCICREKILLLDETTTVN